MKDRRRNHNQDNINQFNEIIHNYQIQNKEFEYDFYIDAIVNLMKKTKSAIKL